MNFLKNIIILIFLFFILIISIGCSKSNNLNEKLSGTLIDNTRVINVEAFRFDFNPNPLVVNKGEKVKLIITSTDVAHGFALSEFNINAQLLAGKPTTIEFVADKQGTFRFFCSVYCGGGHSGMRGKLIVK